MGIEAIGSVVGSIASAVGRGPSLGKMFGAKLEAPLSTMVKEGPALSLVGFRPSPSLVIGQAEKVAAKAWAATEPPKPLFTPKIESLVMPRTPMAMPYGFEHLKPRVVVVPALEPATKTENVVGVQPRLQAKPLAVPGLVEVANPTILDTIVTNNVGIQEEKEEVVDEKAAVEDPNESLEEEEIVGKRFYLKDEDALAQRRYEIREAIIKARAEADRLGLKKIAGWLVAKFLPPEHEGNRSQAVKKGGPDGSYQETVEAIAGTGQVESEEKAVRMFDEIATAKKPVKYGKEGVPVANKDVARVFKYRLFKPVQTHVEVVRRVVRKNIVLASQSASPLGWTIVEQGGVKSETSLEDYPALAEVFRKAA